MFEARIIAGKGRGRQLGFPTLNLEIPKTFDTTTEGIYACAVIIGENTYKGALHFGPIPVFGQTQPSLEIFVLDWDGAGEPVAVKFALGQFLRAIENFASPEALAEQIAQDITQVQQLS